MATGLSVNRWVALLLVFSGPPAFTPGLPGQRAAVVSQEVTVGLPEPLRTLEMPSSLKISDRLEQERSAAIARARSA